MSLFQLLLAFFHVFLVLNCEHATPGFPLEMRAQCCLFALLTCEEAVMLVTLKYQQFLLIFAFFTYLGPLAFWYFTINSITCEQQFVNTN